MALFTARACSGVGPRLRVSTNSSHTSGGNDRIGCRAMRPTSAMLAYNVVGLRRSNDFIGPAGALAVQYFSALRRGQKRIEAARGRLEDLAGFHGRAMPAFALKDQRKGGSWEPVGEEDMYAFVDESSGFVLTDSSGYILAIVDADGFSKAIVQGVTREQRARAEAALRAGGVSEFRGKVILPS